MNEHDDLAEARVGAGPVALPRPLESAAEMADLVRQVRIDHAPQLEDDDQGPFLHFSDASGIALACWPRIIAALSAARAEGAAEAFERAAKVADEQKVFYDGLAEQSRAEAEVDAEAEGGAPDETDAEWYDEKAGVCHQLAAAIRALAEREVRT